jgi:hypothetical protein
MLVMKGIVQYTGSCTPSSYIKVRSMNNFDGGYHVYVREGTDMKMCYDSLLRG